MPKLNEMNTGYEIHKALQNGGGITVRDYPNSHIYVTTDYEGLRVNINAGLDELKIISCTTPALPKIKRVIYNPPATIVFWDDGVKTVVKCTECFSPSRGCCHANLEMGVCERGDGTFIQGTGALARGQWGRAGLYAAIAKRLWGGKAPTVIDNALNNAEWVEE